MVSSRVETAATHKFEEQLHVPKLKISAQQIASMSLRNGEVCGRLDI